MSLKENINFYAKMETDGNDSVNSLIGTVTGATPSAGKIGNGYTFDGVGDYITFLNNTALQLATAYSFSFWFKSTDNSQTNNYILGKLNAAANDNCYAVVFGYHANSFSFYGGSGSTAGYPNNADISISDNNWHHIVYTYDGTTLNGYLDGSSAFTPVTGSVSNLTSTTNFYLGDFDGSGGFSPIGVLDEVGMWSRALTQSEVTMLYNNGDGLTYPFNGSHINKNNLRPHAFSPGHAR